MSTNPIYHVSQNYTDIQSLEALRHENHVNPNESKRQVAKQFEALFLQMVVTSMRQANNALRSEEDDDSSMDVYQDLYDKQLSQVLSQTGTGISDVFLQYLNHNQTVHQSSAYGIAQNTVTPTPFAGNQSHDLLKNAASSISENVKFSENHSNMTINPSSSVSTKAKQFIKNLWHEAVHAGEQIGVDPSVLLAQAGLETHWGDKILRKINGHSSNNLFNIKINSAWKQESVKINSLEQQGDTLTKEPAAFRSYQSTLDSFMDYVNLIKNNVRYQQALKAAGSPLQFVDALQHAGYATDSHYAEKIKAILTQSNFQKWINEVRQQA